ncbi:MAG TPA: hypothetical protein VFK54_12540 [Candidatus Limnocylindrales bacterium]|nr:hypothetical protein [Candidatus Limnocylindrales bacterium]
MSDALYEQYKDALRRGHVAALHGQLEAALAAYEEAAGIAPERALPHASRGTVLARLGRREEALAAFDAALSRSSGDEVALAGRAEVLELLGRRGDAAATYDRLAAASERAGRLVAALDAARRALEAAESRGRRELVRELSQRIGGSPLDEAARDALTRALQVLEADPRQVPAAPEPEAEAETPVAPETGAPAEPLAEPEPEPDPGEAVAVLAARADEALETGDRALGAATLLDVARAHRRAGRSNAALDACYLALSVAPDDPDVHLELVALYDERGWTAVADEKVALLGRLVELDADPEATERVATATAGRGAATTAATAAPATVPLDTAGA